MSRVALLAIALSASPLVTLPSQTWTALAPGTRVRMTTSWSVLPVVGTVVAADSDSVRIHPEDASLFPDHPTSVAIARGTVRELEVGVQGHSHAGMGALIGLGVGAVGGAAIAAASCQPVAGAFNIVSPGQCAVGGAVVFGAVGAGLGALIGLVARSDGWERVVLDHTHAMFGPHGGPRALVHVLNAREARIAGRWFPRSVW